MKSTKSRSKDSKDRGRKRTESVEIESSSSSSEPSQEAMETDDMLEKKLMSDAEQAEHLQLCMKLAAENKINAKNAFGLHLIDIMRNLSTTGHLLRKDLQEASMSLAASTSIYICRVDALHKETMQFHSNLQSLAGKRSKKMEIDNEDDDAESGDTATSGKSTGRSEKRKFKSRLANENDVTQNSLKESHTISKQEPHDNFAIINSSFSCSRTCRKLLHNLLVSSDGSKMDFTKPEMILKPKKNCPVYTDISILPRISRELDNIKQFNIKNCLFDEISSEVACTTPGSFKSANRSSRVSAQFFSQDDVFSPSFSEGDHMCINNDLVFEEKGGEENDVEYITEKMTNLDITCDIFVSDLSKALKEVAGGRDVNVDTTLLPVDSVLKKMLDRTNGTKTKPPDVRSKKTRTRKEHVPFYNLNDQLTPFADIVKLYNLGKNTLLSDDPSDWRLECTSVDEEGYREYDAEIDQNDDAFDKRISEILKMENSERIRALKAPFLKSAIQLMRNSVTNRIFFIDSVKKYSIENPVTMLSLGDTKDDGIISSFAQMSLHDDPSENIQQSFHEMEELESDDLNHDLVDDNNFAEQSFIDENTLQNLMVEPPVLVKPSFIKFEKKQTNVDTDLVKKEMFHIISSSFEKHTGDSNSGAYFSEVYTELKKKQFKMSMQYAFVILLLLSNEKCLSLESMKDSSDILILQDINEVE